MRTIKLADYSSSSNIWSRWTLGGLKLLRVCSCRVSESGMEAAKASVGFSNNKTPGALPLSKQFGVLPINWVIVFSVGVLVVDPS